MRDSSLFHLCVCSLAPPFLLSSSRLTLGQRHNEYVCTWCKFTSSFYLSICVCVKCEMLVCIFVDPLGAKIITRLHVIWHMFYLWTFHLCSASINTTGTRTRWVHRRWAVSASRITCLVHHFRSLFLLFFFSFSFIQITVEDKKNECLTSVGQWKERENGRGMKKNKESTKKTQERSWRLNEGILLTHTQGWVSEWVSEKWEKRESWRRKKYTKMKWMLDECFSG